MKYDEMINDRARVGVGVASRIYTSTRVIALHWHIGIVSYSYLVYEWLAYYDATYRY